MKEATLDVGTSPEAAIHKKRRLGGEAPLSEITGKEVPSGRTRWKEDTEHGRYENVETRGRRGRKGGGRAGRVVAASCARAVREG